MAQINTWEIIVNEFLQSLGSWLQLPMQAITSLGYAYFFVLLLPTIYWCFDQIVGLRIGILLMLTNFVNTFFKLLFHTARPYWISKRVQAYSQESSFGLPSGHSQTAATIWGWLAVEIKKRWFTIIALVLIFLIGVSRLYLGVHFLSDVLLGWLLGGLLILAFYAWSEKIGKWFNERSLVVKLVLIFFSTVFLLTLIIFAHAAASSWQFDNNWVIKPGDINPLSLEYTYTVSGTWYGMLTGFVLLVEKKGRFKAGEGSWRRLVRLIVGLAGLLILYIGPGIVIPNNGRLISILLRFAQYSIIGFWVSWIGPLVFQKLGLLDFESPTLEKNIK